MKPQLCELELRRGGAQTALPAAHAPPCSMSLRHEPARQPACTLPPALLKLLNLSLHKRKPQGALSSVRGGSKPVDRPIDPPQCVECLGLVEGPAGASRRAARPSSTPTGLLFAPPHAASSAASRTPDRCLPSWPLPPPPPPPPPAPPSPPCPTGCWTAYVRPWSRPTGKRTHGAGAGTLGHVSRPWSAYGWRWAACAALALGGTRACLHSAESHSLHPTPREHGFLRPCHCIHPAGGRPRRCAAAGAPSAAAAPRCGTPSPGQAAATRRCRSTACDPSCAGCAPAGSPRACCACTRSCKCHSSRRQPALQPRPGRCWARWWRTARPACSSSPFCRRVGRSWGAFHWLPQL